MKFHIFSKNPKNPKHAKIGTTKLYSRFKILIGSALMSTSVIFIQSNNWLGIGLAISSAIVFFSDISGQTKSAIEVEDRITGLEEKIKTLESNNNTKQDNQ